MLPVSKRFFQAVAVNAQLKLQSRHLQSLLINHLFEAATPNLK